MFIGNHLRSVTCILSQSFKMVLTKGGLSDDQAKYMTETFMPNHLQHLATLSKCFDEANAAPCFAKKHSSLYD